MAEVKPTYIPQSTGMFFANAYLDSHRAKLEKSIAMAQAETQNQMALLEYYRKQEQAYLKYLAKIKGVRGFEDKEGSDLLARQKAVLSREQSIVDDKFQAAQATRKRFDVPQSQVPLINSGAIDVANALSRGAGPGSAADRAIAASANTTGNEQAMASAITMYNAIKSADSRLASPRFSANEAAIQASLIKHFGLSGKSFGGKTAESYFTNQAGFDDLKASEVAAAERKAGARSISSADILGTAPATTTAGGKAPVDTSYEEMMLARIQTRAANLEDQIADATRAEAVFERGKEIYNNQYGGNLIDRLGIRKRNKQVQERYDRMDPTSRYFAEALQGANQTPRDNPFFYREDSDLSGDKKMSADLLNMMIANKGAAKPITMDGFIERAGKMATRADGTIDVELQKKILGNALQGLNTFRQETNPAQFEAEQSRAASLAVESEKLAKQAREEQLLLQAALDEEKRKQAAPKVVEVPVGEQYLMPFTSGGTTKNYGYRYDGLDANNQPTFTFLTLGKLKDSTKLNAQSAGEPKKQYEEALEQYNKQLEEMKKLQAGE